MMRIKTLDMKKPGIIDQYFEKWNEEQKLSFIEFFIHELTICIRVVWADDKLMDEERVERIKWINEILHRLPMIAHSIRSGEDGPWGGPDAGIGLEQWVSQGEAIRELVDTAIQHSVRLVTGNYR